MTRRPLLSYAALYVTSLTETRAGCLRFRMDCYKCITETLNYLLSTSLSHPQAPSVPKLPGPPQVTDDPNRLACAEAEKHVSTSYSPS